MTETLVREIAPGVFKEGNEFFFDKSRVAAEGTRRGVLVIGEVAQNRNARFNERLIRGLHRGVLYYLPEVAGQYRIQNIESIEGKKLNVVPHREVPDRMNLFGRWLERETESLKDRTEDLLGGLRLACEAHYGLVSPKLHPFADGNGRVARLLANGILMMNTHELMFHGYKILPVPLVRGTSVGNADPYLRILDEVNETQILNPFETYIASLWATNISRMVESFRAKINCRKKTTVEVDLVEKFKKRARILNEFIVNKKTEPHIVPDYFVPEHMVTKN